jgi:hypothetical protein
VSPTTPPFTDKQGQYLAFIHAYSRIFRQPPAEADMQRHFQVSPPSVHQMVLSQANFDLFHLAGQTLTEPVFTCSHTPKDNVCAPAPLQ